MNTYELEKAYWKLKSRVDRIACCCCSGANSVNIYNSNGALTADRTVTQGDFDLIFSKAEGIGLYELGTATGGSFMRYTDVNIEHGVFANSTNATSLFFIDLITGDEATVTVRAGQAEIGYLDNSTDPNRKILVEANVNGVGIDGNKSDHTANTTWSGWGGVTPAAIPLAIIYNDGDWKWDFYPNTRDDSAEAPINFLYTDDEGNVLSSPLNLLGGFWINGVGATSVMDVRSNSSDGDNTFTVGPGVENDGDYSIAIGSGDGVKHLINTGIYNINIAVADSAGDPTNDPTNSGNHSIMIGRGCDNTGDNSIAIGSIARTNADNSIALGHGVTANSAGEFALSGYIGFLTFPLNSTGAETGYVLTNTDGNGRADWQSIASISIILPAYDDDAGAGGGGVLTGQLYQTTGAGAAPLNVAGIVMIKQ